jgi:hypothetical protein
MPSSTQLFCIVHSGLMMVAPGYFSVKATCCAGAPKGAALTVKYPVAVWPQAVRSRPPRAPSKNDVVSGSKLSYFALFIPA